MLNLCLSDEVQISPSMYKLTLVTLFLLTLAPGGRVSKLHALLRGHELIVFNDVSIIILCKHENLRSRRDPLLIHRLEDQKRGRPTHPLCPFKFLELYLKGTNDANSLYIFAHHATLANTSISRIRWYLCYSIKLINPDPFSKFH